MNRHQNPNLGARKALGQHFLKDRAAIERIADACREARPDVVFEVGPGKGALTERLYGVAPRLVLVEKDRRFVELHSEKAVDNVEIVETDAARFDFLGSCRSGERAVVVGNLPYNAAAPIYYNLLAQRRGLARLVLMFQREVADRIVSSAGSRSYGSPSVATALMTRARVHLRLPPGAFAPPPKVHSAVVLADPLDAPPCPVEDDGRFFAFVRGAFAHRRKTIANAMKGTQADDGKSLDEAFAEAGILGNSRAEQLSPETLWNLYRALGGR